ncbi:MAG: UDP-N-acetylmuramate dehydrogenase [Clostridia bacterium]|nr:UDP-N-acetylmuramate dehydrogenase [Clostridia bacterium]
MKQAENALANAGLKYKTKEPMKLHTSFKIGGEADFFVLPKNSQEVLIVKEISKEFNLPLTVMGNGSNMLVSDFGIEGIVISLEKMKDIFIEDSNVYAESGAVLGKVASICLENSLTGMEFAAGIPGSIGGAVYMNAGAYGGEMKDIIQSVEVLRGDEIIKIPPNQCKFGYRESIFTDNDDIILSATLSLKKGNKEEIKETMRELARKRIEKQPLEYPSAGSTFKRPKGYFAGALIQEAGLKGFAVGGAKVSEKHAGFVVNSGDATCADVLKLIKQVKEKVYENSGVILEEEVKVIGRQDNL